MKPILFVLLTLTVLGVLASGFLSAFSAHDGDLKRKLNGIVVYSGQRELACPEIAARRPLVLLALGQSNAGNHGVLAQREREALTVLAGGKCFTAVDPLPGATGLGGSIWSRLPSFLRFHGFTGKEVVLSVLAVESTSIHDWTWHHSPLRERLQAQVRSMREMGLAPTLILWQQGEADAQKRTSADDYMQGLDMLAASLTEAGSNAPIILARSTICRSPPDKALRGAIAAKVSADGRFLLGPDTDALGADFRNGCHLTEAGLDAAARMWAETLVKWR